MVRFVQPGRLPHLPGQGRRLYQVVLHPW